MAGRPRKEEGFAGALGKEIKTAIGKATASVNLPTSKDLKKLTNAIRALVDSMKKLPVAPALRAAEAVVYKKKGPKPKSVVCSVEDCSRKHYAKGLCASHYNLELRKRKLTGESTPAKRGPKPGKRGPKPGKKRGKPGRPKGKKIVKAKRTAGRVAKACSTPNCTQPHYAKGLCRKHYAAKKYADAQKKRK